MSDTNVWCVTLDDYFSDQCYSCATDAVADYVAEHATQDDAHRRLAAAFRCHRDIAGARRLLSEHWAQLRYSADRCSFLGAPINPTEHYYRAGATATLQRPRNDAAIALLDSLVWNPYSSDLGDRYEGIYCDSCSEELEPAWITCENCGRDDNADAFPWSDRAREPFEHDYRPTVAICGHCDLTDDGQPVPLASWSIPGPRWPYPSVTGRTAGVAYAEFVHQMRLAAYYAKRSTRSPRFAR